MNIDDILTHDPGDAFLLDGNKLLFDCVDRIANSVYTDNIQGDVIECGVWRGLMFTYMAYKFSDRIAWACDSFEGCPTDINQIKYTSSWDLNGTLAHRGLWSADQSHLMNNLSRYNISTDNIRIVKGWVKDTLPTLDIRDIALLRMDVDIYSATREVLEYLYPKVVVGGYVIFDDYILLDARHAIAEYFNNHIDELEIYDVDGSVLYRGGNIPYSILYGFPDKQGIYMRKLS